MKVIVNKPALDKHDYKNCFLQLDCVITDDSKPDINFRFYYIASPTSNCQLGCFGNFINFLNFIKNRTVKEKLDIFKEIWLQLGSCRLPIVMVDIHQSYENWIDELVPKESIMFKQKYDSTNGSKMMIIQFITKFLNSRI